MVAPGSNYVGGINTPKTPIFEPPKYKIGLRQGDSALDQVIGIPMPTRTDFRDVLPGIQDSLGPAAQVPTVPQLAKVTTIPGFGDDFFDSLFQDAKRKLEKTTFGPGGTLQREEENLASRGVLGSTVESSRRGQINDQFGEQLGSVLSDLNRLKTEQSIEEARRVRDLQHESDLLGAKLSQEASIKNAEFESAMKELGIRSALTDSADRTKYDLGMFDSQVKLEDIAAEDERARRRLLLDLLSSPQVEFESEAQANDILNSIFNAAVF